MSCLRERDISVDATPSSHSVGAGLNGGKSDEGVAATLLTPLAGMWHSNSHYPHVNYSCVRHKGCIIGGIVMLLIWGLSFQ